MHFSVHTKMAIEITILVCLILVSNLVESASNHSTPALAPAPAPAPANCSSLVWNLANCSSFLTTGSTREKPETSCCSGLKTVVKTDPNCVCETLRNSDQLGATPNKTKASGLPAACNVSIPSFTSCFFLSVSVGNPPGTSPALSPPAPATSTVYSLANVGFRATAFASASGTVTFASAPALARATATTRAARFVRERSFRITYRNLSTHYVAAAPAPLRAAATRSVTFNATANRTITYNATALGPAPALAPSIATPNITINVPAPAPVPVNVSSFAPAPMPAAFDVYPGDTFPNRQLEIGLPSAAAVILILIAISWWYRIKNPSKKSKDNQNLDGMINQYGFLAVKRYSYSQIKKMTNSLRDKLGEGGFGEVYKGTIIDGTPVAVKILKATKADGEEFINEVVNVSRTSHINVVTLLGFCIDRKKRALVYEFMPNGSLEKYIYKQNTSTSATNHLGWERLYRIALGVARGLEYLHKGCNTRILHFDIKPHNILLDKDFCPKISDFGLAKQCTRKESIISMIETRGTIGYIAPEVISRNFGGVSHKSDVYSYGMMLLEIVGGRKNICPQVSHTSEIYFPHWAYQRIVIGGDLKLQGIMSEEENDIAKKMVIVGLWCIQNDPLQRPAMSKVIELLEGRLDAMEVPPKPFFGSSSRSEEDSPDNIVEIRG